MVKPGRKSAADVELTVGGLQAMTSLEGRGVGRRVGRRVGHGASHLGSHSAGELECRPERHAATFTLRDLLLKGRRDRRADTLLPRLNIVHVTEVGTLFVSPTNLNSFLKTFKYDDKYFGSSDMLCRYKNICSC